MLSRLFQLDQILGKFSSSWIILNSDGKTELTLYTNTATDSKGINMPNSNCHGSCWIPLIYYNINHYPLVLKQTKLWVTSPWMRDNSYRDNCYRLNQYLSHTREEKIFVANPTAWTEVSEPFCLFVRSLDLARSRRYPHHCTNLRK